MGKQGERCEHTDFPLLELGGNNICQTGKFGKMGEIGGEMDKLLVFCGKMGAILPRTHKKQPFGAHWGWGWGGCTEPQEYMHYAFHHHINASTCYEIFLNV